MRKFEDKVLAFTVRCDGAHLKRVFRCWEAWLGEVRKLNSDMAARVEQENVKLARELQTAAATLEGRGSIDRRRALRTAEFE